MDVSGDCWLVYCGPAVIYNTNGNGYNAYNTQINRDLSGGFELRIIYNGKDSKSMKKMPLILVIVLLFSFLASCASGKKYENIKELDNGAHLEWGNKTYTFYSAVPKDSLIGKQIAIIGGDKKHKVFEVNGYSKEEWIIEYYDVIMSVYALYKADDVTDIPTELQQK